MAEPVGPRVLSPRQRRDLLAVVLVVVGAVGTCVCGFVISEALGALLVFLTVALVGAALGFGA